LAKPWTWSAGVTSGAGRYRRSFYDAPVAVRLAIVVLAAAAIALLGSRLRDHDRCETARAAVAQHLARLTSSCRDPDVIAGASVVLRAGGKADQGLSLARESVRREPQSFVGWVALGLALADRDPAGARRALARAKALNPRWQGLPSAAAPRTP
jgi:hypothetical protein